MTFNEVVVVKLIGDVRESGKYFNKKMEKRERYRIGEQGCTRIFSFILHSENNIQIIHIIILK